MNSEWDPAKAESNLEKHKINFWDAITVFVDPAHFDVNVTKPEYGETRYIAIGSMTNGRMAAVVYTDRDNKRRIISARNARKNEQKDYDQRKATS